MKMFSYSLKTWTSGCVPDTWPGPAEPEARARVRVEAATRGLCRSPSCRWPDCRSSAGGRGPAGVRCVHASAGREGQGTPRKAAAGHSRGGQQPPGTPGKQHAH